MISSTWRTVAAADSLQHLHRFLEFWLPRQLPGSAIKTEDRDPEREVGPDKSRIAEHENGDQEAVSSQGRELTAKREAAQRAIRIYAGLAAANTLNPVPGLDLGVDAGILSALYRTVIATYGLDEQQTALLNSQDRTQPWSSPLFQEFINRFCPVLAGKVSVAVLSRMGLECSERESTKWVPVVGTVISATIGYRITHRFGERLIADCEAAVKDIRAND